MSIEPIAQNVVAPMAYFGHMSLKETAQHAGLSVRTIKNLISREIDPLPTYRITGRVTVRPVEYDEWARKHRALGSTVEQQVQKFAIRTKTKLKRVRTLVRRVA